MALVNLIFVLLWFRTPASTATLRDVTMAVSSLALVVLAFLGLRTWKRQEGRQLARRLWLAARKLTEAATSAYSVLFPSVGELIDLLPEAGQSNSSPPIDVLKKHLAKLKRHAPKLMHARERFQLVETEAILAWGEDIETKTSPFLESPALKLALVLQDIYLLCIEYLFQKDPAIFKTLSAKRDDLKKLTEQISVEDLSLTTPLSELEDTLKPYLKL